MSPNSARIIAGTKATSVTNNEGIQYFQRYAPSRVNETGYLAEKQGIDKKNNNIGSDIDNCIVEVHRNKGGYSMGLYDQLRQSTSSPHLVNLEETKS